MICLTLVLLPGPVQAQGFPVSVLASSGTSCAVLWTQPLCWGYGGSYILGTGRDLTVGLKPGDMASLTSIAFKPDTGVLTLIRSARTYMCATFSTGKATCWGANWVGQCGLSGSWRSVPGDGQYVNGNPTIDDRRAKMVTTTGGTSCFLTWTGKISCWGGENSVMARGDLQRRGSFDAVFVAFPDTASAVHLTSGENSHICALFSNAMLRCWGSNTNVRNFFA